MRHDLYTITFQEEEKDEQKKKRKKKEGKKKHTDAQKQKQPLRRQNTKVEKDKTKAGACGGLVGGNFFHRRNDMNWHIANFRYTIERLLIPFSPEGSV
jgi:hypothetical protein